MLGLMGSAVDERPEVLVPRAGQLVRHATGALRPG